MEYEDRLTIATPEGIELSMTLAGAGSRFIAALVDLAIQLAAIIGLLFFAADVLPHGAVALAVFAIADFLVLFGYHVFFEVLNSGRTPGKQLNGLRVVRVGGHPIGFLTSSIRNVLRLVDILPGAYLVGAIVILATERNQRVGDLVAGTVVVRQRAARAIPLPEPVERAGVGHDDPYRTWDTSRISPEEIAAVAQFLGRMSLDYATRVQLAQTFDARLRPKVTGVPAELPPEAFLEALLRIRRTLGS